MSDLPMVIGWTGPRSSAGLAHDHRLDLPTIIGKTESVVITETGIVVITEAGMKNEKRRKRNEEREKNKEQVTKNK